MKPFLDLLSGPVSDRPTDIQQCIDYFYPLSGFVAPEKDVSPFMSTAITSYVVPGSNTNAHGNLPVQLGEVSMMYGWYLVWRMLLCPQEYSSNIGEMLRTRTTNASFPFVNLDRSIVVNKSVIERTSESAKEDLENLSMAVTAVEIGETVGLAAIKSSAGQLKSLTNLETARGLAADLLGIDKDNFVADIIHRYGIPYFAGLLHREMNIPYKYSNDVASAVVNGMMLPEKWEDLKRDAMGNVGYYINEAANASVGFLRNYIALKLENLAEAEGLNIDREDIESLSSLTEDLYAKGEPSQALSSRLQSLQGVRESAMDSIDKLLVKAYTEQTEKIERFTDRIQKDFSKYGNARSNPEPVTVSILGVKALATLLKGGSAYQRGKIEDNLRRIQEYFTTDLYRLDPNLQSGVALFDLTAHVRKGVWKRHTFKKNNWAGAGTEPDCRLQQGGQVLDYWTHVWYRASDLIQSFKRDREEYAERIAHPDPAVVEALRSSSSLFGRFSYSKYLPYRDLGYPLFSREEGNIRPRKESYYLEESQANSGYTRCQGLGILAKHTDSEMKLVLENLDKFSPFTHAYGFSPTAQLLTNGYMKVNGVAPRRFLGKSNYTYDSEGRKQASSAPGRLWPKQRIHLKNAYGPLGVECWARTSPLPSRRLLESVFGQRCNISFDVGLNPNVPVMDAQFCGLMATLLSHPEALKTCYLLGIPWAKPLYESQTLEGKNLFFALKNLNTNVVVQMYLQNQRMNLIKYMQSPAAQNYFKSIETMVKKSAESGPYKSSSQKIKQTESAQGMSTRQKVINTAIIATAVSGLTYVAYKVSKEGK
jgi:hypothetical protein